jgi:vitamin B12 transport system permease protein
VTRLRAAFAAIFALLSAGMLGLAAGALWMLPTAYLQTRLPWLAWPLGALLGWAVARWVTPRVWAPWLAAGATVLAAAYVSVLIVAAKLAGNMDLGLTEAMRVAGASMLWSLTRLSLTAGQLLWVASGAAISAALAWRCRRPRTIRG